MYQWMHKEPIATPMTPGKLETSVVWPHASDKKTSPKSREGESKIPKLMASTPKARIQLVSSLVTMNDPSSLTLSNSTETDHNKVNELKAKMAKCETIQEMLALIKSFTSDFNMQSSESSTNSGVFNGSMLNGSESTVYDRSMETTVFNVLRHRPQEPSQTKAPLTPKSKTVKARTSPSTPTTRFDPKRIRRNMSDNSVNTSTTTTKSLDSPSICKRCSEKLTSPAKIGDKRMVDKATVMDVEVISVEIQTDPEINEEFKKEEKSTLPPPPPPAPAPPMMNIPPPPPPPFPSVLKIPGEIQFTLLCNID